MIAMPTRNDFTRRTTRRSALTLLALLGLVTGGSACAQSGPLQDLDTFPRGKLQISVGKKQVDFDIWIADTPERQSQGLMFVRSLPEQRGMLFVHESPKPIGMWMKNTYIPLDMLFIRADGKVARVAANTTPHSLDTVESKEPVVAVLELKGGTAAKLGIRAGVTVKHSVFR